MSFDSFFLTAGWATPGLRNRLEQLRGDMLALQEVYTGHYVEFTAVQHDLTTMEQKSEFVERQLEKTLAILSPPPEGEMEQVYDVLEQYVHEPLNMVSTGMIAVGSLMFLIGKVAAPAAGPVAGGGGKIKPGDRLGGARPKPGLRPGAKLGKSARVLSRGRAASKAAGSLTKASKWTKVAKVGSKLGTLGLVIGLVDMGIGMIDAKQKNDEFKAQAREIEKAIEQAESEIEDVRSQIREGRALVTRLLADSGVETVDEFIRQLNDAITDLGARSANIRVARRMLLDGLPTDRIALYVPALAAEVLADLGRKLDAERRLLAGEDVRLVAEASGLSLPKVQLIAQLQIARGRLIAGDTVVEAAAASGASDVLVEGEDETLLGDLQALWARIDRREDPAAIARQLVIRPAAVEELYRQLELKQRLYDQDASAEIDGVEAEAWREDLAVARDDIGALARTGILRLTDTELAADYLLPLAVVEDIRTLAAAA